MKNIHGAKKGGGKQRQPVIAPDSAQSKTYIKILYGLGEGEIAGLANGYKAVYLDDTPLQNDNGEFNFPNVKVDFRSGTNDQTYIDGFADVASETAVNIELKHGTPWVKSFNNLDLDAVRVRLKWGALRSQNTENGDVNGVKIDYAIDVKTDNGGWVEMLSTAINAKTSDAYERSHRIDLPTATQGWQVRVRRLTPNSTSDFVSDKMYISAITEVIDLKLRYPNTALLGLRYDAESFSNVAKMSALCRGLIIKVPSNYDPVARTYTGMWDGQFKMAYSNNPAWVYYDLCTATRYGLGGRLKEYMIDKWSLYRLAQYCDQMVDDGMGGTEPRFTVNIYIQSAEGAFEILSKLAGVFRAISYWDGTSIVLDADIPQDSMYSFSRANVIDGMFEYTGTRARDRHTVAKVAWDNPANHFKTEYEFIRDEKAIAKFGVRVADIQAWGCTSKGQAQRAGIWALKSEHLETRMVTFKVGLDGYIPAPAKVIEISDELFAGRATGGRVLAINDKKTVITLDRAITAKAGDTLVINGDDGVSQRRQIESVVGDKITVTKAFGDISVENVWVLDSADLATMKFRVLSVTADENHQFTITAVQYNPAKYDAIDTGAYIDERPISVINPTVQAPAKAVNLSSYHTVNQGVSITTLIISWEQVAGAVKYTVEWRKDNGNWQALPPTGTNSIEISGVYAGQYEARVTAISAFGQASHATHSALTQIQGKVGKPNRPAFIRATGKLFGMDLAWTFNKGSDDTNYTEIQVSPDGRSNITILGTFAYPTNSHTINGLQGNLTQFYRARIMDKLGNTSDWTAWVSGTTDARADKVLDIISGQIRDSHLDQTLRTPIGKIGGLENAVMAVNGNLVTLNNSLATARRELQTTTTNITTERNRITSTIRDITVLQSANTAKTQEIANLRQTVGGHTSSIRELGVTTGDLSQKYTALKTATDAANSEITAIKQTQAGQALSVERLGAKFDNLAVGSRNLLLNSDRIMIAKDKSSNWNFTGYELSQALVVGQTYTFSADVNFTEGVSDKVSVLSYKNNNLTEPDSNIQTVPVVNGKITGSFIATVPNDGRLLFYAGESGRTYGKVAEVKNAKLERGTIATDWTPAPEDTEQDFAQTNASMNTMRETLTNADKALSRRIDTMDSEYKAADRQTSAKLGQLEKTISDKDGSTAQRISQLQAEYNALNANKASQAALTAEQNARAEADRAHAESLRQLNSRVDGNASRITTVERTANDTKQALATAHSQLSASYTNLDNKVNNLSIGGRNLLRNSRANINNANYAHSFNITQAPDFGQDVIVTLWGELGADRTEWGVFNTFGYGELATLKKVVDGVYQAKFKWQNHTYTGDRTTNRSLNVYAYPNTGKSINRIDKIKFEIGKVATDYTPAPEDNDALIDEFKQVQATKDGAIAQKLSTLQTTVNGQIASIEQHAQSLNGLQAQWTLKMQTGGVVGGIGLAGDKGVIDFAVNANKFYIAPPTGGKGVTPFVVLTSPQMLNGVRVPAGTYIKSAFIQDGSIDIAKINKASINSLSALSANIGHFKSAQTGARLEIKDSVPPPYDANNTLRVRLGLW